MMRILAIGRSKSHSADAAIRSCLVYLIRRDESSCFDMFLADFELSRFFTSRKASFAMDANRRGGNRVNYPIRPWLIDGVRVKFTLETSFFSFSFPATDVCNRNNQA